MPPPPLSRRRALARLGAAGAGLLAGPTTLRAQAGPSRIAGRESEIAVTSLGPSTVRLTVHPLGQGPIPEDGALVPAASAGPVEKRRGAFDAIGAGDLRVRFTDDPPVLHVETASGRPVQRLTLDAATHDVSFLLPRGPLLGMGQGGPQFDRKGSVDEMRNGQGGYRLRTHGGRVPIQWLVGTDGWGLFIHRPLGAFDFTGDEEVSEPTTFIVYPGADGTARLYEDDGTSFDYRKGDWMGIDVAWRDSERTLSLTLSPGSRVLPPSPRTFLARLAGSTEARTVSFRGEPVEVRL
jgi:hypothetical protein